MSQISPGQIHRPIRVTYLITDLETGGVPLHLYRLARRLLPEQVRPRVISLADRGPVGDMLSRAGIPVLACGARSVRDLGALVRLWQLLRGDSPDVLHALLFHANVAARIVGPLAGVPTHRIVCEIQTVERERPWHLVVDNLTCRLCRCEIGNSVSVVEHLRRCAHIPASRLRCEPGAVDLSAIASAEPASRAELGLPDDEPVVLWTGRLDPVKGFEQMLGAFAELCADRPARFVLAGEGDERPAVEKLIRAHHLEDRVTLLGRRSDVPALLKMADVFLFCSRTEGMPNALAEAMGAGLPVVATDVPGCRDLVRHGQTGLLVPLDAIRATRRALGMVLDDAAQARAMGAAASAWVRRRLDVSDLAGRWTRFYRSLLARPDA